MTEELKVTRTISGVISTDPLRDAPLGTTLNISSDLFVCHPQDGLNSIANWELFNGVVVAIHFGEMKSQRILGSGVLVAPSIVITARHVIEPEQDRLTPGQMQIICTGVASHGLMIWTCHQVTLVGNADVALLMVRSASALPSVLRQATLTTRMPRVGERLVVAGTRHHAGEPVKIGAALELSMMVAQGTVTARYERARDRVMLPSPCVEVNCPAIGGMSGGPAFDESGFLVGLVTSSVQGELDGPTFLSLLWPALVETINPCWPDGLYKKPTSLLEMDRRLCAIHRPEAIQISHDDSTGRAIVTYHHWE